MFGPQKDRGTGWAASERGAGWLSDRVASFRGPFQKVRYPIDIVVKPIEETIMTAVSAVSELVRGEPLAPQLKRRLDRADARRTALRTELDALALDAELGEPDAAKRIQGIQERLGKAADEVTRLEAALATARKRDNASRAETEIGKLEAALRKYETYAVARVGALKDQLAAIEAVKVAARRYQAATSLLNMPPSGTSLPRGFVVGQATDLTVAAIEAENGRVLRIIKQQFADVAAIKRGEEIAHD
jgi:hypothetical protein